MSTREICGCEDPACDKCGDAHGRRMVLVDLIDDETLGVFLDDVLVSSHCIENEWRTAGDAAKELAAVHGLRFDFTLQARNELNMG